MRSLSRRIEQIEESKTLALQTLIQTKRRQKINIISLGAGEPDFPSPDNVKQAGIEAIQKNFTVYTPSDGIIDLKEAIIAWMTERRGLKYTPDQIVVTCGAKHAVAQAILAVCNPGDEVLLPAPYWVSYPEMIKIADGVVKILPTTQESGFKITASQLEAAISPKTRALIMNSPSNPTGAIYSQKELANLIPVLKAHDLYVISDEIYDEIVFDGLEFASMASFREILDQVILINGVSKAFAMTGWRIGYLAAEKSIARAVSRYQGHTTSNPTSISQKAALAAYLGKKDFINSMNAEFDRRRHFVIDRLNQMNGIKCPMPAGAFYAFPNIEHYFSKSYQGWQITSSEDLCKFLIEQENIALVPGSAFGSEGYVRLSYAASMATLQQALDRIESGLKKLDSGA